MKAIESDLDALESVVRGLAYLSISRPHLDVDLTYYNELLKSEREKYEERKLKSALAD